MMMLIQAFTSHPSMREDACSSEILYEAQAYWTLPWDPEMVGGCWREALTYPRGLVEGERH